MIEQNRELEQFDGIQKRQNLVQEDINLGRFVELATTNKIYVNSLKLPGIKKRSCSRVYRWLYIHWIYVDWWNRTKNKG